MSALLIFAAVAFFIDQLTKRLGQVRLAVTLRAFAGTPAVDHRKHLYHDIIFRDPRLAVSFQPR
jgi:hypothetical protein